MNEETALLQAIEDDLAATDRQLVYSDWLIEQGRDELAFALRWMVWHRKHPHKHPTGPGVSKSYPFIWTCEDGLPECLPHAGLPRKVCTAMSFHEWQAYATLPEALDHLAVGLKGARIMSFG